MNYKIIDTIYDSFLKRFNALDVISISGITEPVYIRQKSMDIFILEEVFKTKCYNIEFINSGHYRQYRKRFMLRKPKYILDIGGHIGLASIYYANIYPDAKIITVEPDEDNFYLLQKNIMPYKNIIALKGAVWSEIANLHIENKDYLQYQKFLYSAEYKTSVMEANDKKLDVYTIEKIIQDFGIDEIDVLKIDVEGAEKNIFSKNYENWLAKTKLLLYEQHDFKVSGCSNAIFNAVSKYPFYHIYDDKNNSNVMMLLLNVFDLDSLKQILVNDFQINSV